MNLNFSIAIVLAEIEKYYPLSEWDERRMYGDPDHHLISLESLILQDTDKQAKKRRAAAELYYQLRGLQKAEKDQDDTTATGDLIISFAEMNVTLAYNAYKAFLDAEEAAKLKGALDEE